MIFTAELAERAEDTEDKDILGLSIVNIIIISGDPHFLTCSAVSAISAVNSFLRYY